MQTVLLAMTKGWAMISGDTRPRHRIFCESWRSAVWGRSGQAPLEAVSGRLAVLTPSVGQFGPYLAGVTDGIAPHLVDAILFVAWRSMVSA